MIDSDQQSQISTLQLENDELKTELEIAHRELNLLRKKNKRDINGHASPKKDASGYTNGHSTTNNNNNNKYNGSSPRPNTSNNNYTNSNGQTNNTYKDKDDHIGSVNPRTLSLKQLKDMI